MTICASSVRRRSAPGAAGPENEHKKGTVSTVAANLVRAAATGSKALAAVSQVYRASARKAKETR
jgi:hypothetical protein